MSHFSSIAEVKFYYCYLKRNNSTALQLIHFPPSLSLRFCYPTNAFGDKWRRIIGDLEDNFNEDL